MAVERVLLVDDDAHIRLISALSLRRVGGWTVIEADSGQQAIDRALSDPPDVILLDVMMPGMDGVETLRRMREHSVLGSVPVVFLTAKVQAHEVERYKTLGAIGVISKPFDPMTLPRQLQELIDARGAGS